MANRLSSETSPYLLQHAENPVDWYPWGEEALSAAQKADKPILLSIGYSACHWCHVMERESFENPLVAARMNTHFINIKVDREERPDLDELYMRAVQAFNDGNGGWPLTVFLTPKGEPFFGGTYFPPTTRGNLRSFVDVMEQVRQLWMTRRPDVEKVTEEVVELLERSGAMPRPTRMLGRRWLDPVVQAAAGEFDTTHGGFGTAPKFPPHGTLAVLLAHHIRSGASASLDLASATLDAMSRGGMYDLLGGGFARYSVDAEWRVPHFEKMLYDNAQLVPVYVDAWRLTGHERYARVVRETLGWAMREMSLSTGGFAASQDADSEGREGAFFAWTPEQLQALLGDDAERVGLLLEVTPAGTFEHGGSVLRLARPREALSAPDLALLDRVLPLLFEAREGRERPPRDDKVLTSWNALMVSALARAGAAMGRDDWVTTAASTATFLLETSTVDGRLMRTFKDGRAHIPAYADDHANLVTACLDLWEATYDTRWIDRANELANRLVDLFWDELDGGLFLAGNDQPALVTRAKSFLGGAEPAANGTAALAFLRLDRLCGREDLRERAEMLVRAAESMLRRAPRALGPEALAGAWMASGGMEVAIVGDPADPATEALLAEVRRRSLPLSVSFVGASPDLVRMPWLEGKAAIDGKPTAFVCEGHACQLPVQTPTDLGAQLDTIVSRPPPPATPEGARVHAPELPSDPARWLGTDTPLQLAALKGHVVVLDFWTYCCINCLHGLSEIAAIEERFAGQPVVVIGVHAAKFDAEKVPERVREAMARHRVTHPVVLDADHDIWESYAVRSWPTVAVIDPAGRIALQQPGEPDRDELTKVITALLEEGASPGTGGPLAAPVPHPVPGPAPTSELSFPGKVHVWPTSWEQEYGTDALRDGRMYIADTGHHRIIECRLGRGADGWPTAEALRTFGGGEPGLTDGLAATARFRDPQGMCRHEQVLYVADTGNHALRGIDIVSGGVTTLAGTGRRGRGTPDKEALRHPLSVSLRSPWDVEVMPFKRHHLVYIAMAGSHQIWVYGNNHIGIYAGSGREDHIDAGAASAALAQPSGLALYGRYLLVADSEISSVRAVDLQAHQVLTVVGRGLFDFGDIDGESSIVRLQHPLGITYVGEQIYVADTFNHKVKQIDLSSGETHTVVGGDPDVLREPGGITRAGDYLIVADTNNHRIRAVHSDTGEIRDLPVARL